MQLMKYKPVLQSLFKRGARGKLTFAKMRDLLTPTYSPEGSNRRASEKQVMKEFVKYLREVAGMYGKGIRTGRWFNSNFQSVYRKLGLTAESHQ